MFQLSSLILSAICFISFVWSGLALFTRPNGITISMRVISAFYILSMILHLNAIILAREINLVIGSMGLSLYITSLVLFWWAVKTTKDKPLSALSSHDLPNHILVTGPYKLIRHPFYTSYLLFWLAGVLLTNQLWLHIIFAIMLVLYYSAACREEAKFFSSPYSAEYKLYKQTTGMFLPKLLLRKDLSQ